MTSSHREISEQLRFIKDHDCAEDSLRAEPCYGNRELAGSATHQRCERKPLWVVGVCPPRRPRLYKGGGVTKLHPILVYNENRYSDSKEQGMMAALPLTTPAPPAPPWRPSCTPTPIYTWVAIFQFRLISCGIKELTSRTSYSRGIPGAKLSD